MVLQWYPGHMEKARRDIQKDIKQIDLIIELLDARCPRSSENPEIDRLAGSRSRIAILNKADLADETATKDWIDYYTSQGRYAICVNSTSKSWIKKFKSIAESACEQKRQRDRSRGILPRPLKAMVVGIPNVGKSTFINSIAGRATAKTGNRPGVTRGSQWIKLDKNIDLLDTPGILWGKIEDEASAINLALIGSMNDENINLEELAICYIELIKKLDRADALESILTSKIDSTSLPALELLEEYAKKRGCMKKGGILDTARAAAFMIQDFRAGRHGMISLELRT